MPKYDVPDQLILFNQVLIRDTLLVSGLSVLARFKIRRVCLPDPFSEKLCAAEQATEDLTGLRNGWNCKASHKKEQIAEKDPPPRKRRVGTRDIRSVSNREDVPLFFLVFFFIQKTPTSVVCCLSKKLPLVKKKLI